MKEAYTALFGVASTIQRDARAVGIYEGFTVNGSRRARTTQWSDERTASRFYWSLLCPEMQATTLAVSSSEILQGPLRYTYDIDAQSLLTFPNEPSGRVECVEWRRT